MKFSTYPLPSSWTKSSIAIFTILLFHTAGLPFIIYEGTRSLFLSFTPFTLTLSACLLLWNHKDWSPSLLLFALTSAIGGFGIEVIGVQTGILFGSYEYGSVLGWKFLGVPLVIGVNWLMCSYCCGVLANRFVGLNDLIKAFMGASLMVLLDVVIEPVAIKMDFWQWQNNHIPLWNYGTWFIASFALLLLFQKLSFNKQNPVASVLYLTLFLFFAILNFV
ncbi:MAG: carotenoid biosynthesis protein [Chitinophagales bacterium]